MTMGKRHTLFYAKNFQTALLPIIAYATSMKGKPVNSNKQTSDWQPIDTGPTGRTLSNGACSERVLLWVPPYGPSTGHYDDDKWHCHSVLNKDAVPTHWKRIDPPKEVL